MPTNPYAEIDPGATGPETEDNPYAVIDPDRGRPEAESRPPQPTLPSGGWLWNNVARPVGYVAGKAAASALGTFEPAAQAEMAAAGVPLAESRFDPNQVVFGTDKPQAPGPVSEYAGEIAAAAAANPFLLMQPEALVGGSMLGHWAGKNFENQPLAEAVGGAIGGGIGGIGNALSKFATKFNTFEGVVKNIAGDSKTLAEGGAEIRNAARQYFNLRAAIIPYKLPLSDTEKEISVVANQRTATSAAKAAMQGADGKYGSGERLTILRQFFPDETNELARGFLSSETTRKGWTNLADQAKEALVEHPGLRVRLDRAASGAVPSKADMGTRGIIGLLLGEHFAPAAAQHLASIIGPTTAEWATPLAGALAPVLSRGAGRLAGEPVGLRFPAVGALAGTSGDGAISLPSSP